MRERRGGSALRRNVEDGSLEIALLLLLLHRSAAGVAVDRAPLPLAGLGQKHFGDDLLDGRGLALHRARKRVTAERAEADGAIHRLLPVQREAVVVDHEE